MNNDFHISLLRSEGIGQPHFPTTGHLSFAVIGITDKFSHPSSRICTVLSSSTNPRRSTATPPVCLLAEPSKSQVRRTQAIGQRLVCENVPRMQARSAPHDWLTLTAIDTAHLCKSGRPHFISASLESSSSSWWFCVILFIA